LAQSERGIAEELAAFDRDPRLLNVANGTVALSTGVLREHRRADFITKLIPVAYDPAATCPTFTAFLRRIFANRQALIDYVQRAIGYSLTGLTTEQILWLCWGVGANGKTTLMQAIARLLSGYSASLAAETLLAKKGDAGLAMNDLAEVQGARFVIAVESDMGRRLAEALVKAVTGGESVKVKRLYRDVYSITPTFKLWIGTNHKPVIRGTDLAIWRRIHLVPFETIIPEAEQDHQLLEKLEAERPGVLRWAIDGCLAWQRQGLGAPEEVRRATAAYRGEMDSLGDFLEERCVQASEATITAGELYEAYLAWAKNAGEPALPKRTLGLHLTERGFAPGRRKAERRWVGLRLRGAVEGDATPPVTQGDASDASDAISGNFLLRAREKESSQNKRHLASPVTDASPEPWRESDMFDPEPPR
jgi:putative DNA primase/helicase